MTTKLLATAAIAPLMLLIAGAARAQAAADEGWIVEPGAVAELGVNASAPYHLDGRGSADRAGSPYRLSWGREGLLFGVALLGSQAANLASQEHAPLSEEDLTRFSRADVFWFDRPATLRYSTDLIDLSEQVGLATLVAPLLLMADPGMRSDWQAFAVMYAQTSLLTGSVSELTKELIPRHRPYVYNSELSFDDRTAREPGKAFFSSAAAFAFARAVMAASFFSDHHPDSPLRPYVWSAALGGAAAVGYLRYASGIHYPSDVVVGALVGSAIGYAVPRLHRAGGDRLTVSPDAGARGAGISARIAF